MRTGIVLAGGRSSRFGSDKLAADLDGASMLAITVAALGGVLDRVVVAGPSLPANSAGAGLLSRVPVALVRDREAFSGPLVALDNVLGDAPGEPDDLAIVVGGDMPRLVPAVLRSMLDRLAEDPALEAILLGRPPSALGSQTGKAHRRAVLPLAIRVERAARAAREAVDSGDRSLQALVDRLAHVELPYATWQVLDPEGRTLLDVDTVADLERIRAG